MGMESFTPFSALAGGVLIGLASALLLIGIGKLAGISGIVDGLLEPVPGDTAWRAAFLAGLLVGAWSVAADNPWGVRILLERPLAAFAVGGFLVGFGTRLGNGCTSGHGVCGIARGSTRSVAATLTFLATGILTVTLIEQVAGGLR
jgi:uncharacterized membrane protein YedE/YeeE